MRAFVILSSLPDIVFVSADDEFLQHLDSFAAKRGIEKKPDETVNADALQMQLLPIFAAQEMLDDVNAPVDSFITASGHAAVMRQFDDHMYVAVSKEGSRDYLLGQVELLRKLVRLLYGPVTAMLKPSSRTLRTERWRFIDQLMKTVSHLRQTEQCFMVQAIEPIRVNTHVRSSCVDALEYSLSAQNPSRNRTGWGSHALLLVGSKVLAMHSRPNAPDLRPGDIFLISVLVQDVLNRRPRLSFVDDPLYDPPKSRTMSRNSDHDIPLLGGVDVEFRQSVRSGTIDSFFPARDHLSPVESSTSDDSQGEVSTDEETSFQSPGTTPVHSPEPSRSELGWTNVYLDTTTANNLPGNPPSQDPRSHSSVSLYGTPLNTSLPQLNLENENDNAEQQPSESTTDPNTPSTLPELPDLMTHEASESTDKEAQKLDARTTTPLSPPLASDSSTAPNTGEEEDISRPSHTQDSPEPVPPRRAEDEDDEEEEEEAAEDNPKKLRELRREVVFLKTPNNTYAPFIMHCAEVAPSIALVLLSQGQHGVLSELMHQALHIAAGLCDLAAAYVRREKDRQDAEEMPKRVFMAVRGATGQACALSQINGNFEPLAEMVNDRRAYERSAHDAYMFYHRITGAWCIGEELGTLQGCAAMVEDTAQEPDAIRARWEVWDHDLQEYRIDHGITIACVRGDGHVRNSRGAWARQSTNGLFYCGQSAICTCGACNGVCGPLDGCNCSSCKEIESTRGCGVVEMARLAQIHAERSQAQAVDALRSLKRESELLTVVVRKMLQVGHKVMTKTTQAQCHSTANRLADVAAKIFSDTSGKTGLRYWHQVMDHGDTLGKLLRAHVGEKIAQSNQYGTEAELEVVKEINRHVSNTLRDYTDFLELKIHRNVTMSYYLEKFPGLVHFIYVDRSKQIVIAPCLSPASSKGKRKEGSKGKSLKEMVWDMHRMAQQRLKQGYTTLMLKAGDFQFSYRLWFEDADGSRLVPRQTTNLQLSPEQDGFHRQLVNKLFPEERTVSCYELYLVHLAVVPLHYTTFHSAALVKELRANAPETSFTAHQ
eukprot:m.151959 g.151959  ORF g.151959 m.151959 type:complete len:1051 (-) comp24528_c1_seq3:72-3224(-)